VNNDTEITITIRGGEAAAGGVQLDRAAVVPAPSAEMAEPGAISAGVGEAAPAPDAMEGAEAHAGASGALPEPVPLDQLEQLVSSAASDSGSAVATPEHENNEK